MDGNSQNKSVRRRFWTQIFCWRSSENIFRRFQIYCCVSDWNIVISLFLSYLSLILLDLCLTINRKDKQGLRTVVTEKAYPVSWRYKWKIKSIFLIVFCQWYIFQEVTLNMNGRTSHWKFLESVEPPRVVHARQTEVISKENIFAQITCRFHTKQVRREC